MSCCLPTETPIDPNIKFGGKKKEILVDQSQYHRLVGKLIYLSHTRLDIAFVISLVSQFMHSLKEEHPKAIYKLEDSKISEKFTRKRIIFQKR